MKLPFCNTEACFLFVIYTLILIVYLLMTNSGVQLGRIQNSRYRKYIADKLFLGSVMCTYYGFLTLWILQKGWHWLLLPARDA